MIIIQLLWLALILCGVGRNENGSSPMELRQTVSLRGICAIEIMIGHIGLATGNPILYPNRKAGILFVGIFFLLSGYGVAYGIEHKKEYLRHFIVKKLWKLLLPAYIAYAAYIAVLTLFFGEIGWAGMVDPAMFFAKTNWYVWEQLGFYIVFCLLYAVLPQRAKLLLGILSVIFIGIAFVTGMDNPYYGSTLCFVLGMYYQQFEEPVTKLFKEKFPLFFVGAGAVLILSLGAFFVMGNDSVLGNPVARNAASVSFCVIVILLLGKFRGGGRISYLLGRCSYEIFLVHLLVLELLKKLTFSSQVVFAAVCIVVSLAVAAVLHLIVKEISAVTD